MMRELHSGTGKGTGWGGMMLALILGLFLAGCTQAVVLTSAGEKVKLMDKLDNPADCEKPVEGMEISATRDDPLGTYPEEIQLDINNTARNKAAELGGNVIVPKGPAKGGKQHFDVYKCPNP